MGRNPSKKKTYKGFKITPCSKMTRDERWYVEFFDHKEEACPKFSNLSAAMNFVDHQIDLPATIAKLTKTIHDEKGISEFDLSSWDNLL